MGPLLLLGSSIAWPCAGISHAEGVLAESDASEVLFEPVPGTSEVTVTYAVRYVGDAPDLGWVIPVPTLPTSIQDGDPARFDALREASQPIVESIVPEADDGGGGGCGCGAASKSDAGGSLDQRNGTVTVVAQGFTGTYDYIAVAATEVTDLEDWFTDNGWTGLAAEDLDHYVQSDSVFVALRVVPDSAETPTEGRELPPIAITYGGDAMVFPSVMALHGTVLTQRTTVYVASETRAIVEGWTSEDGGELSGGIDDDPAVLWDAHLAGVGAGQGFVRTFAGEVDGDFVTRFDTLAPREVHDADAVFALEDSTDVVSSRIVLTEDGGATAALLLVPLAGLGALRRRRR